MVEFIAGYNKEVEISTATYDFPKISDDGKFVYNLNRFAKAKIGDRVRITNKENGRVLLAEIIKTPWKLKRPEKFGSRYQGWRTKLKRIELKSPDENKIRELSEELKERIKRKYKYKCRACLKFFKKNELQIDHKIPYRYGGSKSEKNLIPLCENCHGIKSKIESLAENKRRKIKFEIMP